MKLCLPCQRIPKKVLRFIGLLFVFFALLTAYMLNNYHTTLMQERQNKTQKLVENAYNLVAYYYGKSENKELKEDQARRYALESIEQLAPSQNSYFWVMDTHPRMIMHPIIPEMNGQDLTDYAEPNGQKLFLEIINIAKTQGEGFIHYLWPKPGMETSQFYPKVSFVKLFGPWDWIIGSGVYVDDIESAFWNTVYVSCGLSIALLMFVLALAMSIFENIKKP